VEKFIRLLNRLASLDKLIFDNSTKNKIEYIKTNPSKSVEIVNKINIPYQYKANFFRVISSNTALDNDLPNDAKKRFHYFMHQNHLFYERMNNILKQLLDTTLVKGKPWLWFIYGVGVLMAFFFYFSHHPVYSVIISIFLVFVFINFGAGLPISGLRRAIIKKINQLKTITKRKETISEEELEKLMTRAFSTEIKNGNPQGKILKSALRNCDIEIDDLTSSPILLKEIAMLQSRFVSGYRQVDKKSYFHAWWISHVLGIVSAIYYVKVIFLLKDKVEIYSSFYDIVTEKEIGKDIQSFYYKDIAKVSESDDYINITDDIDIPVTQFKISLNSSDKISFNFANDETDNFFKSHREISIEEENGKMEVQSQNIQNEIDVLKQDLAQASGEEKTEIENEIKNLEKILEGKELQFSNQEIHDKVSDFSIALKNIVKQHKKQS